MRLGTRRARPARNAIFTVSTEPGSKVHFASLTLLQLTNHEDIASREPGCGKNSQPIRPYIFFSHKGRQKGSRPNKCQCCTHGLEPWRFRAGLGPVATTNKQVLLRFTQGPHAVVRSFSQGRRFRLAVEARPHQNRARGTSAPFGRASALPNTAPALAPQMERLLWWSWSRFRKCLAKQLHLLD